MIASKTPRHQELIEIVSRHVSGDGDFETAIKGLRLHRKSGGPCSFCGSYRASFALIAQGEKQVTLGSETYSYGGTDYLLTSLDLPVTSQVVGATPEEPYLAISFEIDTSKIAAVFGLARPRAAATGTQSRGMSVNRVTPVLEDVTIRLVRLLETPEDIPAMFPLIEQELIYRLLTGPQGERLRQIAVTESQSHQVSRACLWLKEHYARPLKIEDLASRVSMSVSSLHHHFKSLTAMSPMQYQKQLRLQEARRLMLEEMLDAGAAGHQVGYESQSQFSREYARHFGEPPLRDVGRLRRSLIDRPATGMEMLSEG